MRLEAAMAHPGPMRRFAPFAVLSALAISLGGVAISPLAASADPPTGLDPTYGVEGVAVVGGPDGAIAIADDSDPSGRMVIATVGGGTPSIHRLTPTGGLDPSFGVDGAVPYPGNLSPLRVQATGTAIYLAGTVSQDANGSAPAVARLTSTGALDLTWGGDGIVELPPAADAAPTFAFDVGPAGEVAIAVGGPGTEGAPGYRLYRILANGTVDGSFNEDGVFEEPSPAGLGPSGVQIDSTGRILVAEASGTMCDEMQHHVRRLLASGAPDTQFGTAGVANIGQGGALAAAISPIDGSIYLGGCYSTSDPSTPAVWKLRADGSLDPTFGVGGRATNFGTAADQLIEDLVLLPNHRIAVASRIGGDHAFLLRPDGTLETELGTDGAVPAPHWTPWDGLGVGANGQLLVVASDVDPFHTEVVAYAPDVATVAPTITSVTAGRSSLSVRWDAPELQMGGPVRSYYVYALDGGVLAGAAMVAGDLRQATVAGLTDGHPLQVVVLPFTDNGAAIRSDAVSGTPSASAPAATPSAAVQNLTGKRGNGFATVTWAPPVDDGGSPITLYSAVVTRLDTHAVVGWRNVATDVRSASFPLSNNVAYSVIVMPYTSSQGYGAVAPAVRVIPAASVSGPSAPTLPYAAATATGSSAYVAWGAGEEHGEAVAGYQVLVVRDGVLVSWTSRGVDDRSVTVPIGTTGTIDVYVIANSATLGTPIGPIHVRP
jgi:uncharacterized delta-60 repeat protein